MSFEPDKLLERRRLKRSVLRWRVVAIVALVAFAVAASARFGFDGTPSGDHIARLWVDGIIVDDPWRDEALAELADDPDVVAVLVRIDSPGGTAMGGEALYLSLREIAAVKPVVAVLGTTATSAAYMAALAADHIVARQTSITGSIGVIFQTAEFTEMLDKLGIRAEAIKSTPLKAQPSPLEPLTDDARRVTRAVVKDIYDWFVSLVVERRSLSRPKALAVADGRIFTGRQALNANLVDAIGGEEVALAWLQDTHNLAEDLPVGDVYDYREEEFFSDFTSLITRTVVPERLSLDGLIAVWHPGLAN